MKSAIGNKFKKDSNGQIIDELKGDFLEFTINGAEDLDKMVANIIYYMLKYNCIAAINEGNAVKSDNDPSTKYALIASPRRLYNTDHLSFSNKLKPSFYIKNSGLSDKAVELYKNLFRVEQGDLYLVKQKPNSYSAIWEKSFTFSPYVMRNSHLFKQYFIRLFDQRSDIIDDLRSDYTNI